jgi:hypothetical protein
MVLKLLCAMAVIKREDKELLWSLAVNGKTVSKQTLETERVCEVTNHIELCPN